MVANLGFAFYDITLFLLGLFGVKVLKYLYDKLGQENIALITIALIGVVIICSRWL